MYSRYTIFMEQKYIIRVLLLVLFMIILGAVSIYYKTIYIEHIGINSLLSVSDPNTIRDPTIVDSIALDVKTYTEKPKEVEFCAGIRGHLVGSDAKNNSLINELSSGRLCRFQLPIYKDYYETWKGMQALYKSYKNSNYSQQIKASLLLVNKVSLILESLGEGVKTSKLILEKGSRDQLYFANGELGNEKRSIILDLLSLNELWISIRILSGRYF